METTLNIQFMLSRFFIAGFALFSICVARADIQKIDLRAMQDDVRVLNNPDKGWYHHYYDNCLTKYLGSDEDIGRIPNLNHLFLRFAWCYLEPEEGKFNWDLIDDQIKKWAPKGVQISLSITCQETGEPYATPKWVIEAGAKGAMYKVGTKAELYKGEGHGVWEPDYGDPVYLEKLENLQKAIAKRYDGKDSIVTVTIASIGNWGEGHNSFTSRKKVPVDIIKKHIDIYAKYFKKSQIVIGDDCVAAMHSQEEIDELREYVKSKKISYRDDSILVNWTYRHDPSKFSFLNPGFFADVAEYAPTTLEMEHYGMMKQRGEWVGKNGSEFGADIVREVIRRAHCTFLGFHGYAKEFLDENPDYAKEMANKVGYWFFINEITFDKSTRSLEIVWDNRGAAHAYHPYRVYLKFKQIGGAFQKVVRLKDADVREFMPGTTTKTHFPDISDIPAGRYELSMSLKKRIKGKPARVVELGFKESLRDADGFYKLGEIEL